MLYFSEHMVEGFVLCTVNVYTLIVPENLSSSWGVGSLCVKAMRMKVALTGDFPDVYWLC